MSQLGTSKSSVLFLEASEQTDPEWKTMFSQMQLFPMKMTDKSKYNVSNCPRPFPKLADLYGTTDELKKGINPRNPSLSKTQTKSTLLANKTGSPTVQKNNQKGPIFHNFVISKPNRTNITRTRSSGCGLSAKPGPGIQISKPTHPRPVSAPSHRADVPSINRRSEKIQIGPIEPDSQNQGNYELPLPKSSIEMLNIENSTSSVAVALSMEHTPTSSAVQMCRSPSSHTIQQDRCDSCSNLFESLESSGDLINKGMELLAQGKNIIETSRNADRMEGLTEVDETLNDVVHWEMKLLIEENESLRTENNGLQKQLLSYAKIEDAYPIDPTKSTGRSSEGSVTQISTTTFESPNLQNLSSPEVPQCTGKEITQRLSVDHRLSQLEGTVGYVFESYSKLTANLQDRLFLQEVRYEETLAKFEEVIANMTKMLAGLQTTYELQTTNGTSKQAEEFKDVLASIANFKISPNKKVQFKGILKP